MTAPPVRAVVVDDSATARLLLVEILRRGGIEVVGEAADGAEAARVVGEVQPSVVVMDIEMPGVDGFEATKRIMADTPTPIVIVTSRHDPRDVAVSLQATRVGALTVQPKPRGPSAPEFEMTAARFVSLVRAMADVKVVRRRPRGAGTAAVPPVTRRQAGRISIVGVGASTGGPAALYRFLESLPPDLTVPVLVVQHIPDGFAEGLVRWLSTATALDVHVAEHGERLDAGTVLVAPHGTHLGVSGQGRAALVAGPGIGGFRPSASALFSSLGTTFKEAAAAVVLTGMGDDGLEGARDLRAAGGIVLAQDEDTSVVFGMPRAVADAGVAHHVGPVETLAARIGLLSSQPTGGAR